MLLLGVGSETGEMFCFGSSAASARPLAIAWFMLAECMPDRLQRASSPMAVSTASTPCSPKQYPIIPLKTAVPALPAWFHASLRPSCAARPFCPTSPKVIPVRAGVMAEAAAPCTILAMVTAKKEFH